MKYLSWMSMMLVASQGMLACSDDDDSTPGTEASATAATSAGASATGTPAATTGSPSSGASGTSKPGVSSTPSASQPPPGASASSSGDGGGSSGPGDAGNPDANAPSDGDAGDGGIATLDIVDTAVAAGSFKQLAAALERAGLVDALKGEGPFTVFAPSDEAFDAFNEANPDVLAGLSVEALGAILKYHVVAGAAVESGALKDDQVFLTLNGSPVLVDTTGGVKVSDASVTTPDVLASNGVIHVIDKIIMPPADDIVATAIEAGFSELADALTAADLVEALQGPGPFTVFAPTDAAFGELAVVPMGDELRDVLLYHVVSGAVGSGDLVAGQVPTLLEGQSVDVTLTGGVKVNDVAVTTANIITKNGVIHVVDSVLLPE
jgi:transforming growth factor-beta-induced protein